MWKVIQMSNIFSFLRTTANACIKRTKSKIRAELIFQWVLLLYFLLAKYATFSVKAIHKKITHQALFSPQWLYANMHLGHTYADYHLGVAFAHKHVNMKTKEASFCVYSHGCFWHGCLSGLSCGVKSVQRTLQSYSSQDLNWCLASSWLKWCHYRLAILIFQFSCSKKSPSHFC